MGTVTEIYDYLRLLWARIGHPHCHICGRPISGQSAEQIIDQVMELADGTRFMVLAPVVRGARAVSATSSRSSAPRASRGPGRRPLRRLDEEIVLDKKFEHDVGRRRPAGDEGRAAQRLADSVETAVALADGLVGIELVDTGGMQTYSETARVRSTADLVELEPRIFSFRSPHGACLRCTGLGSRWRSTPSWSSPIPRCRSARGRSRRERPSASDYYDQLIQAIAERYDVDLDTSSEDLPEQGARLFLYGTNGDRVQVTYGDQFGRTSPYATTFDGIIPNLEQDAPAGPSPNSEDRGVHDTHPVPGLQGTRLRQEVARGAH